MKIKSDKQMEKIIEKVDKLSKKGFGDMYIANETNTDTDLVKHIRREILG